MLTLTMKVLLCWIVFLLVIALCVFKPITILVILALAIAIMITEVFVAMCSSTPKDDQY